MSYSIEISDQSITNIGNNAAIDFYNTISFKKLQLDKINAAITGCSSPFLNVVIDTLGTRKKLDEKILQIVTQFFENDNVPWVWIIPSYVTSTYFVEPGFVSYGDFPCMYYDLYNEVLPIENLQIIIQEINRENNLSEWIIPVNEGFTDSETEQNNQEDLYQKINANLLNNGITKLRQFVAYYDNQLAGSSTLFLSRDSVTLHNIAVRPHLQKRGIGKSLTLYMMHIAKELGFKHCFLDSSDDGYKLYKQLGFGIYAIKTAYKKSK